MDVGPLRVRLNGILCPPGALSVAAVAKNVISNFQGFLRAASDVADLFILSSLSEYAIQIDFLKA